MPPVPSVFPLSSVFPLLSLFPPLHIPLPLPIAHPLVGHFSPPVSDATKGQPATAGCSTSGPSGPSANTAASSTAQPQPTQVQEDQAFSVGVSMNTKAPKFKYGTGNLILEPYPWPSPCINPKEVKSQVLRVDGPSPSLILGNFGACGFYVCQKLGGATSRALFSRGGPGRGAPDAWPPPAVALSLAPAHVLEGLQHMGDSSLQPTSAPLPIKGLWGCCTDSPPTAAAVAAPVVQQPLSCCCCTVAAWLLQHVRCSSLQPTFTSLPSEGLLGYCTSSLPAAAAAILLLQLRQLSGCSCHVAAFWLLLLHYRGSSPCAAAACGRQLTAANPRAVTNRGAMGVLHR